METTIAGLHHVTAISGPPQPNVDFYTGLLGQRLVKKTVNFDAPDTYHLYYGDRVGTPGTIMTFFPFVDAGPGRAGPGMASAVAYGVPSGGLDAWVDLFAGKAVDFDGPVERFGQQMIAVRDPDGMAVELIETANGAASAGQTHEEGFHSVTLWLDKPDQTARLLTDIFGYEAMGSETTPEGERQRFQAQGGGRGAIVDLVQSEVPSIGRQGAGTIHHIAFRTANDESQLEWRERIASAGLDVTPVIDRQYFNAIYFREPGGVLFEIATEPPGFANDETVEELGRNLKLPPKYEAHRQDIERILPPITVPA